MIRESKVLLFVYGCTKNIESIIWLKKYDPTGMWYPLPIWQDISEFREEIKIFL